MKRVLLLALLAGLLLAGMVSGSPAQEAKEIALTGMVRDYTLQQNAPWTSAIETFKQTHPNVKITLEGLPYNDQREKALITVGAGKGPDIIQVDCIWLGEFASNKIVIDLTERLNKDAALKNDYIEAFFESSKWQGKPYGLWLNSDVRMLAWHKDQFEKAGLNPEVPPKSWAELRDYARKLNRPADGVWGYAFPAFSTDHTADRWYPFLHMGEGGAILSPDYTKAAFNGKAGVEALQLLVDLMRTDKVSPQDLMGIAEDAVSAGFKADKYAMQIKVGEFWADYRKEKGLTPEQYRKAVGMGPLPIPAGGKPATGAGGWILGISRDSKNPDVAYEFLKLVVSADNAKPFLVERGMVPTRKSLMAMEKDFVTGAPYFSVVQQTAPYARFRPPIPEYTKISAEIVTAIQKALTGTAAPKEALDEAAVKANEILAARKW
jgi:multiple sugar transport system substrate-binding protein